jgi:Fur family transcriptional regulator, ferric uptake regulator
MLDNHTAEWIAALKAHGYRISASLQVVVDVIASSPRVLSPVQVYDRVRRDNSKIGLVTVYRTLEKLEEIGLVQRVHQPSGCQAFIAANAGHQHILICENCGLVEFFSGDKLDSLMSSVAHETGYRISGHWLQLFGLCTKCQREGRSPSK